MTRLNRMVVLGAGILALGLTSLVIPAAAGIWQPPTYQLELTKKSDYSEGCIFNCLCPIWYFEDMRGSMNYTYVGYEDGFNIYHLSDIEWAVYPNASPGPDPGAIIKMAGEGYWYVSVFGSANGYHKARLTLKVKLSGQTLFDGTTQKLDSGYFLYNPDREPAVSAKVTTDPNDGCVDIAMTVQAD